MGLLFTPEKKCNSGRNIRSYYMNKKVKLRFFLGPQISYEGFIKSRSCYLLNHESFLLKIFGRSTFFVLKTVIRICERMAYS